MVDRGMDIYVREMGFLVGRDLEKMGNSGFGRESQFQTNDGLMIPTLMT